MQEINITDEQKERYQIEKVKILDDGRYWILWKNGNPNGMFYKQDDLFFLLHKLK